VVAVLGSGGSRSVPIDATVQQEAEPVVAEVALAVPPDSLHLLDQRVDGLGRSVGDAADVEGSSPLAWCVTAGA